MVWKSTNKMNVVSKKKVWRPSKKDIEKQNNISKYQQKSIYKQALSVFVSFIFLSVIVLIAIPFLAKEIQNLKWNNNIKIFISKDIDDNSSNQISSKWNTLNTYEELTSLNKLNKSNNWLFDWLMKNDNSLSIEEDMNIPAMWGWQSRDTDYNFSQTNTQFIDIDEPDILKILYPYAYYIYNNNFYQGSDSTIPDDKNFTRMVVIDLRNNNILWEYSSKEEINTIIKWDKSVFVIGAKSEKVKSKNSIDCFSDNIQPNKWTTDDVIDIENIKPVPSPEITEPFIIPDCYSYINYTSITEIDNNLKEISTVYVEWYFEDARIHNDIIYLITSNPDLLYREKKWAISMSFGNNTWVSRKEISLIYHDDIPYYSIVKSITKINTIGLMIEDNVNILSWYSSTFYYDWDNILFIDENNSSNSNITLFDKNLKILADAQIRGKVLNSYSVGSYNWYIYLATTWNNRIFTGTSQTNYLIALDNNLNEISYIEYSKWERIYSARFINDKAYVVTFYETDPLIVFDISNPKKIEQKWELHIPWFSSHLQIIPWNKNILVWIWNDVENGMVIWLKLSLFDISDDLNPKEIDKISFSNKWGYSYSEATYNPRSIMVYDNIIWFPLTLWNIGNGYIIYEIKNNKLVEIQKFKWEIKRWTFYSWKDKLVYLWTDDKVVVFDIKNNKILNTIRFEDSAKYIDITD